MSSRFPPIVFLGLSLGCLWMKVEHDSLASLDTLAAKKLKAFSLTSWKNERGQDYQYRNNCSARYESSRKPTCVRLEFGCRSMAFARCTAPGTIGEKQGCGAGEWHDDIRDRCGEVAEPFSCKQFRIRR
ncbi:MAG: hypothetical protein H0W86_13495 [Armatimonadetes bacterium]|nr:hypothetical protein [Armatimonadota bacterium]